MSVFASLEESIEQRIVVRGFRHVDGFKKKYNIAEEIESKPFELNRRFNRGGIFHGTVTTQRSIADMKHETSTVASTRFASISDLPAVQ